MIHSISYVVDISKMENDLLAALACSKIRDHCLGLLGYSVFGIISGHSESVDYEIPPIKLNIKSEDNWPNSVSVSPMILQSNE